MTLPKELPSKKKLVTVTITQFRSFLNCFGKAIPFSYPYNLELESEFWDGVDEVCRREHKSLSDFCSDIQDSVVDDQTLEQAIRYFVFEYFHKAATEQGHLEAGHGQISPFNEDARH